MNDSAQFPGDDGFRRLFHEARAEQLIGATLPKAEDGTNADLAPEVVITRFPPGVKNFIGVQSDPNPVASGSEKSRTGADVGDPAPIRIVERSSTGRRRKREAPPMPPTFEELARAGDFESLASQLQYSSFGSNNLAYGLEHMSRAIDLASSKDPEEFAQQMLRRAISFSCCIAERCRLLIKMRFDAFDSGSGIRQEDLLLQDTLKALTPQLFAVERQTAQLLALQARVTRDWEKIKEKRLKHSRQEEHGENDN